MCLMYITLVGGEMVRSASRAWRAGCGDMVKDVALRIEAGRRVDLAMACLVQHSYLPAYSGAVELLDFRN